MLAVALRALAAEMPLPDPLLTSAHFLRPGAVGPTEVRTEVVRSGRRTATGESTLHQEGREIVRLVATFGDLGQASGRTAEFATPPALPPPDEAPDVLDGGVDGAAPAVLDLGVPGSATLQLTVHVRRRLLPAGSPAGSPPAT